MKRVLITGVTGFVGSHLADFLLNKEVEIFGTFRWRSPKENIKHIINKLNLVNCELLDSTSVMDCIKTVNPDVIFHLAAQSYVPVSFKKPKITLETNIIGTLNLLEAVRHFKLDPVIHICSTSEVYGQVKEDELPIKETNPLRPASPYAVSKVGEDLISYQYYLSYGLKTIRTRMFTHTGPRRGEVFVVSAFAKQIAMIELGQKDPVLKVGNLNSVRTFLDVRDAVRAYWLLVKLCKPGEVYNIAGYRTMSIREMLDLLLDYSSIKNEVKIEVDSKLLRPSDVTLQIPNIDKFVRETNWKAEIPLEKTLQDTLNYWRNNLKINYNY